MRFNIIKKRLLAAMLAATLAVTAVPGNMAMAADKDSNTLEHGLGYIPATEEELESTNAYFSEYTLKGVSLPTSYNLVDEGYVTSVKDQGKHNTCWAFAECASIESNALMKGYGNLDLSEAALSYFTYNTPTTNVPRGLEGDVVYSEGKEAWSEIGGNSLYGGIAVINGYGLNTESAVPYSKISTSLDSSLANGNVIAIESVYRIQASEVKAVKEAVMTNGAVVAGLHYPEEQSLMKKYYNDTNNALYVDSSKYVPNHDVVIVGWDDNYSKDNFTTKPANNGAFICKNSYGEGENNKGYFYLAYEDVPSSKDVCYSYVTREAKEYDNIYQYDGGIAVSSVKGYGMANIFTASEDDTIEAVELMATGNSTYTATVAVYTGVTAGNPVSGKLKATVSTTIMDTGYQTIKIPSPVSVKKGKNFSIVVTFNGQQSVNLDTDYYFSNGGKKVYSTVKANKGESFVKTTKNGGFADCVSYGNVRLKALATKGTTDSSDSGEVLTYEVPTVKRNNVSYTSIKFSWNSVDNANNYKIYRKEGTRSFELIDTVGKKTLAYSESGLKPGTKYTYKIRTTYTDGTVKDSNTVNKPAFTLETPKISSIANSSKGTVTIKWGKVKNTTYYYIYRREKGGKYAKIGKVGGTALGCKDRTVTKGKTYYYKVQAVGNGGLESALSSAKKIKVTK